MGGPAPATEAARRWADAWQRAWEARDVDAVVALYADGCRFSSQPFRAEHVGLSGVREYVQAALADERDIRARFEPVAASGDRAVVAWWAQLEEAGQPLTLAGISLLRFDGDGLVQEQRDTWNQRDGRVAPADWWPGPRNATG